MDSQIPKCFRVTNHPGLSRTLLLPEYPRKLISPGQARMVGHPSVFALFFKKGTRWVNELKALFFYGK